ncbi:amidohydrolase family protein [Mucilaginibacter flavidus]|uniref:amidohydrolase family protein n=1 Tax=Mucilaginibacter flavidus TaxID=2949309 RepID=UPI0035159CEC
MKTILKNARVINEGRIWVTDLLIEGERIAKIAPEISVINADIVDCEGKYLMPGMIDGQVHFREPGLTHKADMASESRAAVAGGITSFMDMPNTVPAVLIKEHLEEKFRIAARHSLANYSFFMGVSRNNWEEALSIDPATVCGLSDDGLYLDDGEANLSNDPAFLDFFFCTVPYAYCAALRRPCSYRTQYDEMGHSRR